MIQPRVVFALLAACLAMAHPAELGCNMLGKSIPTKTQPGALIMGFVPILSDKLPFVIGEGASEDYAAAHSQCSASAPETRKDCFKDQGSCVSSGCCWSPVQPNPNNYPWCFYPAAAKPTQWTNHTITATTAGIAFAIQTTDGSNLTKFGEAGICGSDPKTLGHGLCQKCGSQLYAADFDCTGTSHCRFGVATSGKKTVIVGWSEGGQLYFATVKL